MNTKYYRVGGHAFCIQFTDECNDETLLPSFSPFELREEPEDIVFTVISDDSFQWQEEGEEIGQFDCGGSNHGVYRDKDGNYQFEVSDYAGVLCACIQSTPDFAQTTVALKGTTWSERNYGLNNALMMAYAFATAEMKTMLVHASVIRCEGKGYLMTAPSGTGKSTHTRLWYENIPGCDLMNDDNPVVRVEGDKATIYGSPWSGKTPCYRNIQAPIGAFIRIKQRPENAIRSLETLEAFIELLSAMSNMKWDRRVYNGICTGITELLRLCPIYELGCLPDAAAAHLCHDTVLR